MKLILSLGMVRGALAGLLGTGIGIGLTMLGRMAMGMAAWSPGPDITIGMFTGALGYLIGLGVLNHWARWAIGQRPAEEEPHKPAWTRYFSADINHKVIGIQYLTTALVFLPFAVALQILARLDLSNLVPGVITASTYESVVADHGIVMLFIVAIPAFAGMMNYTIPLLVGARDMAFPHLNAFSYGLLPPAGLLAVFSLAAGGFHTGWTVYAPLSALFEPLGMDLILVGVFLAGLSSILTAVNVLTTIFRMRAPGMTPFRMPVFVWSAAATTGLSLLFTQFIAISFLLVLFERHFGLGYFEPSQGGQPLLYQYLFWFYSHPAVYVFVLPGLGIISDLVPVYSRKPLFGYKGVAISSPGIAFGGMVVFAHHMFAAGIPAVMRVPFMVTTLLVAVPTGVKVFAWVWTMYLGKLQLRVPFLFVLTAMVTFLVGGLMGIPLGVVPTDLYLHDTYFVVGHFHAMLFGGFLLPAMAGIYYWYPKATGRMMSERLGRYQWLLMTVGTASLIIPMLGLGILGQRRRVAASPPYAGPFQPLDIATMVAGILIFAGLVILIVNMVRSRRTGQLVGDNPWESETLEWQVSSPPPENNFLKTPQVVGYPYNYGIPGNHAIFPGGAGQEREI